jgi:hypothetical protein
MSKGFLKCRVCLDLCERKNCKSFIYACKNVQTRNDKFQDKSKQSANKKSKTKGAKQEIVECKQEPIDEEILCVQIKREPQTHG